MRKSKHSKYKWLPAVGMIMILGMSACQQSPDASIVVHKDLDNMIDQAQNNENGSANVAEAAGNYETYQTTLQDENLGVTINVDARVDIPEVDQMSVLRVAQTPITQELLDRVKEELVQGETLYDGAVLSVKTRSELEEELRSVRNSYNAVVEEYKGNEEMIKSRQEELQMSIDRLQKEYEVAPAEVVWSDYPSDGQIHGGDGYYGVSDGQNGRWTSLYIMNNSEKGNCLRFRTSKEAWQHTSTGIILSTEIEAALRDMNQSWGEDCIWSAEEEIVPDYTKNADADATISMEEAVQMAEDFLERVGIEGYQYYNGGLFYEQQRKLDINEHGYRKVYVLSYMRNIDGGFVTYDSTLKMLGEFEGENFRKRVWSPENIEFRINDDGIVGFDYNAPLEIVETVVDQSNLKSFDEIRSTFETMATIINADPNYEISDHKELNLVNIEVDQVVLGYALVSEPDSFDTGLLVPVWDFKGVHTWYGGDQSTYHSVMTINAIDGTVIDRSLGY